jgi:hypothetical protein
MSENSSIETNPPSEPTDAPVSQLKLRANRLNAQNSSGPNTPEGKERSSQNAVRHGLLSKKLKLSGEELEAYNQLIDEFISDLQPKGTVEIELARTCADLQYRLNVASVLQHNALFDLDAALEQPQKLATLSIYEQRLRRSFIQTMKQFRDMQTERRALEKEQLQQLEAICVDFAKHAENMDPAGLGFVCSKQQWLNYWYAATLAADQPHRHLKREECPDYYNEILAKTLLR